MSGTYLLTLVTIDRSVFGIRFSIPGRRFELVACVDHARNDQIPASNQRLTGHCLHGRPFPDSLRQQKLCSMKSKSIPIREAELTLTRSLTVILVALQVLLVLFFLLQPYSCLGEFIWKPIRTPPSFWGPLKRTPMCRCNHRSRVLVVPQAVCVFCLVCFFSGWPRRFA